MVKSKFWPALCSMIIIRRTRYSVFNDIAAINLVSNMHDQRFVRDTKNRWKKYRPRYKARAVFVSGIFPPVKVIKHVLADSIVQYKLRGYFLRKTNVHLS